MNWTNPNQPNPILGIIFVVIFLLGCAFGFVALVVSILK